MSQEILSPAKTRHHVYINTMWWRQIFKESFGQFSSILSGDFTLEDYSELPHQFFDSSTILPGFYRYVGSEAIEPTDSQKETMVFANATGCERSPSSQANFIG